MDANNNNQSNIDSQNINISVSDIADYFGDAKRPLREGEEILNAGWIYVLGVAPPPAKGRVIGLVIQTSAMSDSPHEIKLDNLDKRSCHSKCVCSCKAGQGEKCKHIAACLLSIFRAPRLEGISCTELKQKWGKLSKSVSVQYSAVTVRNMCHVLEKDQAKPEEASTAEQNLLLLSMYTKTASKSELAKTKAAYRSELHTAKAIVCDYNNELYNQLICHDALKMFVPFSQNFINDTTPIQYANEVVKSASEALTICKSTMKQSSAQWLVERKIRITGSMSYNVFTYASNKNPNWSRKLKSIYNGNFAGNDATRYGQFAEKLAKRAFSKHNKIVEAGLIISPNLPFLGVSPDGFFFTSEEWKLLEIKCPVKEKFLIADDLLPTLPYLILNERNEYQLKQKHEYYGQIQLGLALTNLTECDLLIYSSCDNTYKLIRVSKNLVFLETYIKLCTFV